VLILGHGTPPALPLCRLGRQRGGDSSGLDELGQERVGRGIWKAEHWRRRGRCWRRLTLRSPGIARAEQGEQRGGDEGPAEPAVHAKRLHPLPGPGWTVARDSRPPLGGRENIDDALRDARAMRLARPRGTRYEPPSSWKVRPPSSSWSSAATASQRSA